MMDTNLIIVEGLPGTGKSTTAAFIAEELKRNGKKVVCVDEGEPHHPADYDSYDFPNFETESRLILNKWADFVAQADKDTVYVFNCIFLQNPMCETMMRFDLDQEASRAYIKEIAQIVKPMKPFILYLSLPDVRATVDRVLAERGEWWLNSVVAYHTKQGYGKRNGLKGYDGYIECLVERKRREMGILQSLDLEYRIFCKEKVAADLDDIL